MHVIFRRNAFFPTPLRISYRTVNIRIIASYLMSRFSHEGEGRKPHTESDLTQIRFEQYIAIESTHCRICLRITALVDDPLECAFCGDFPPGDKIETIWITEKWSDYNHGYDFLLIPFEHCEYCGVNTEIIEHGKVLTCPVCHSEFDNKQYLWVKY